MIPEASNLLDKAERSLRNVDHMVYITYPLIKENKLLKLMLEQLYEIANCIVNAILKYEYAYKRIQLYQDSSQNFETFKRCAPRFDISSQEVDNLKTLLTLMQKHRASSVEFIRKDRFVFMSENMRTESINLEQLKKYLNNLKILLQKAKTKINKPLS